jgi:hypothetical protein
MNSEKAKRLAKWMELTSGIAGVASAAAIAFAFYGFFNSNSRTSTITSKSYEEIQTLQQQIVEIKNENERLSMALNSITFSKTNQASTDAVTQIAALHADVQTLGKRVDELDDAIMDDPTKALSVPLLRRDLESLKSDYQRDSDSSAKQIDRIYDQNKWFIGLMFSMAIGLIGLAISNFIQARKKSE